MPCVLVIIGHDPNFRLDPEATALVASPTPLRSAGIAEVIQQCPKCENGASIRVTSAPQSVSLYTKSIGTVWPEKPAESYVLRMQSVADAHAWIDVNAAQLVGKTVLMLGDPGASLAP